MKHMLFGVLLSVLTTASIFVGGLTLFTIIPSTEGFKAIGCGFIAVILLISGLGAAKDIGIAYSICRKITKDEKAKERNV